MDFTLSPPLVAIIVTVAVASIGFIVWLVRLEGKTNLNSTTLAEKSETAEETHGQILAEVKEVKVEFYKHLADNKAHHNEEANKEFRKALERRLDDMDGGIKDISRKLNHLAGRE